MPREWPALAVESGFVASGAKYYDALGATTRGAARAQLGFFLVSETCHACDGSLHGWYVDEVLTIACIGCTTIQVSYPFPPSGLDDRTPEELLQAFHHYVRHYCCLAADGVCPECTGPIGTALVRDPATPKALPLTSPSNTTVSATATISDRRSGSISLLTVSNGSHRSLYW